MMNLFKFKKLFVPLIFNIRNDPKFNSYKITLTRNEFGSPYLVIEDKVNQNTCVITYSSGMNCFRLEHYGGIENTSFRIKEPPELILTTIIQNSKDYQNEIFVVLEKSFTYTTAYSQWLSKVSTSKIVALPWESNILTEILDSQVLFKKHKDNHFLVVNKRNQTFEFSEEEFLEKFKPLKDK